ncbi:MAG: hypothetical protein IFK94_11495 [Acidobacteria bacterium]|uniref:Cytochrome C n=1 Tax=Candidatus Polarisedimenticola svalbardensis TaxID=2886004 RepID=A0A8J6Y5U3_9BACT|nr:hypothetical protein [Candidatus Polarisedimenticola svalbardensis]
MSRTIGSLSRCSMAGAALFSLAALAILCATPANAIPAFARKYETSCQTCHVAYPKLNTFGQAFRLLGYRMPGETEGQVKRPDVALGAASYKRVWPDAVWPGAIPQNLPLSLVANFQVQNSSQIEIEDGEVHRDTVNNDMIFPSEVALVVAGTAGEHVSYFGEIGFEQSVEAGMIEQEVGVEHIDIRFIRPIRNSMAFNVKIGSFQPELVSGFDHARRLTVANYDSMFGVSPIQSGGTEIVGGGGHHGGGGGISLPAVGRGIDLYGVVSHRFTWAAGILNGIGPGDATFDANSGKDTYVKGAYKWGGLAPDGSNAAVYAGSPKNWREKSVQVGVFYYRGDGKDIFFREEHDELGVIEVIFVEDPDYTRTGLDFNWYFKDLNIFGAYVSGDDDLRIYADSVTEPGEPGVFDPDESGTYTYKSWFVEADMVLGMPWLHGAVRYETVDLPRAEDGLKVQAYERATLSMTALVRANVKGVMEYTEDLNESRNYQFWLGAGIAF